MLVKFCDSVPEQMARAMSLWKYTHLPTEMPDWSLRDDGAIAITAQTDLHRFCVVMTRHIFLLTSAAGRLLQRRHGFAVDVSSRYRPPASHDDCRMVYATSALRPVIDNMGLVRIRVPSGDRALDLALSKEAFVETSARARALQWHLGRDSMAEIVSLVERDRGD